MSTLQRSDLRGYLVLIVIVSVAFGFLLGMITFSPTGVPDEEENHQRGLESDTFNDF